VKHQLYMLFSVKKFYTLKVNVILMQFYLNDFFDFNFYGIKRAFVYVTLCQNDSLNEQKDYENLCILNR